MSIREEIKRFLQSRLLRESALLWVGSLAGHVSNYLFHVVTGRLLGPVGYGILASLIAVLYIVMVPGLTIRTVVMKFTAEREADKDYSAILSMFNRLSKRLFLAGMCLFLIFVVLSRPISSFLNIDSVLPLILLSFSFLVIYVIPVNRGIIQGLQKFFRLSVNLSIGAVFKLALGFFLIYLGFSVNGAIIGIVLGMFIAYGESFLPIRFLFKERASDSIRLKSIAHYSIPVFFTLLCLTAFYNVDIIIVKHFMSSVQAGLYSGLSIIGKIVIFASLGIVWVMFPKVTSLYSKNEEHGHYLLYVLVVISVVGGAIVSAYFLIPKFIVSTLFGVKYLPVAPYMGAFGVAMLLLSLSYALANYYLAIQETKYIYILTVAVVMQVVMISLFHSSIAQIVLVMNIVMSLMLIGLVLYYFVVILPQPTAKKA